MESDSIQIYYLLFLIFLLIILSLQFPLYSAIFYLSIIFIIVMVILQKYYEIQKEKRDQYVERQQKEMEDDLFGILHLV